MGSFTPSWRIDCECTTLSGHRPITRRSRTTLTREGNQVLKQPAEEDALPTEAPLLVQLAGEPWVTTMRTPGEDHALVHGLLLAEGLIESADDVGRAFHCGDPQESAYGHTMEVVPGPGTTFRRTEEEGKTRRGTLSTSSCGVCGRQQIEDLMASLPPLPVLPNGRVHPRLLFDALGILHRAQPTFARTGSVHGAAAFDAEGALLATAEDIGRHNAVDKVIGRLLLDDKRGQATLLALSGRASFEVVQKAARAAIPVVVTAKGPSSLAVELATEVGMALCGFARDERVNVYCHGDRLHPMSSDSAAT